jgi:hypothetical protein
MVINNSAHPQIKYSPSLKFPAYFISVLFHPLFIPIYVTYYITFINPLFFTGINDHVKYWLLLRISINMVIFPALMVLLLKGVGFINSVFLKTQKDRIIPYIGAGTFYFWMYLVFRNQPEVPLILTSFVFAIFLSSYSALIANIYFKVSMHAIGMGGILGILLIILFRTHSALAIPGPLMIALLLTGIVCTSRMIVSDHTQKEIYAGLFIGILCQYIGALWVL